MKKIILISCVSKKLDECAKADSLYISPLFKFNLAYAKSLNPDKIFVLSTEYGLLELDDEINSYDKTLNKMSIRERKDWAKKILSQLSQKTDLKNDKFIFLAGKKYREHLTPYMNNFEAPMKNLGIGKQLKFLKENICKGDCCEKLHKLLNDLKRYEFPFNEEEIPKNGIYILFEKGEGAHGGDRIVRIGTHTGDDQLRFRLKQHFVNENKDRSIFRKNIGRALLNQSESEFLKFWELDMTTRKAKEDFLHLVDMEKQKQIETSVSNHIKKNFSFVVFEIEDMRERLNFESKIISTVSKCNDCKPSKCWFGLSSPKEKIRRSGLWLVNELFKKSLSDDDFVKLESLIKSKMNNYLEETK